MTISADFFAHADSHGFADMGPGLWLVKVTDGYRVLWDANGQILDAAV